MCRSCGAKNPDPNHQCTPKSRLCGGEHLTADKSCRAKFKTPHIVKKRRWERKREEAEAQLQAVKEPGGELPPHPAQVKVPIQMPGPLQFDDDNRGPWFPPAEPVEKQRPQ
ncbi:hypothetical protein MTO96_034656 [Rhipicephalus appendiculatus]